MGKRSQPSLDKLLFCEAYETSVDTWGSTSQSNIDIIQRFQS